MKKFIGLLVLLGASTAALVQPAMAFDREVVVVQTHRRHHHHHHHHQAVVVYHR